VLTLALMDLINDLYPNLRVGPASVRLCVVIRLELVSHRDYLEIERSRQA
jgi:hypothetical protein